MRSQDPNHSQSHTLQVNDVFHKQQWLNCLRSAISVYRLPGEPSTPSLSSSNARSKRRPSSASAIVHMEETDENCQQPTSQSAPSTPCNSTTPSPTAKSPSSNSSPSSPVSPLSSFTSHKTKKDKKSLYSLGKRKETMVWAELPGENGLLVDFVFFFFVHKKKPRRRNVGLVFMCVWVCVYNYNSVLCYCPVWQLFTLLLHPTASHRAVFWRDVHSFHQLQNGKHCEKQTDPRICSPLCGFLENRGGATNPVYY